MTITLNVNGLNASTKRHRLAEWIQKGKTSYIRVYKRPTSDLGTHTGRKWGLKEIMGSNTHIRQNRF